MALSSSSSSLKRERTYQRSTIREKRSAGYLEDFCGRLVKVSLLSFGLERERERDEISAVISRYMYKHQSNGETSG